MSDNSYNRRIIDLTKEDRPREKAIAHGLQSLTTTELIALLLGSGNSRRICHQSVSANFAGIRQQTVGIGETFYSQSCKIV